MSELETRTLKGSGGHVVANLTEHEMKKARLGGPELFLGALGRIDKNMILKYYCKNCNRDYEGAPEIKYEKVNQEVAKGYTLSEQGEYLCKQCGSLIAQYKKFAEQGEVQSSPDTESEADLYSKEGFIAIRKLVGRSVFDDDASLLGTVKDIGLRDNKTKIVIVISTTEHGEREVPWEQISKIGDVVFLKREETAKQSADAISGKCTKCGFTNKQDSRFCEQCGNKLV
jgi:sporulation protein YlmC with PRC-barrel domain